jgi:serine/threonine-protein phosphatase 2A regulatory subunit A
MLFHMAEELAGFVQLVGGPEYSHHLLGVLEALCAAEEPAVRSRAIESLSIVLRTMTREQHVEHLFPMLQRLSTTSWYTNRMSAASLYPVAYELLIADGTKQESKDADITLQKKMLSMFIHLLQDDTPMVRRAAAIHFPNLLDITPETLDKSLYLWDLFAAFLQITQDEQDSVRLLSVKIVFSFAEKMTLKEKEEHLFPVINGLFLDKSWRVRFVVAENFSSIAAVVDRSKIDFCAIYVQYIQDYEAEVRSAALEQLEAFCKLLPRETLEHDIMPALNELITDPSPYVRASFANRIDYIAPLLGKDLTLNLLMPILMQLLNDENSDVRLNVISNLEKVNHVVGIQVLAVSLLPAVVKLASAKQWRVRLAVVENIPILASQLGVSFFNDSFLDFTLGLLGDRVFSVREASIASLKKIMEHFGLTWSKDRALPKVLELSKHKNYLYRITLLFSINSFCTILDFDTLSRVILPVVSGLSQDAVPNVRFNVAKTLQNLDQILSKSASKYTVFYQDIVRPTLEKLLRDSDPDVQYYANLAIQNIATSS